MQYILSPISLLILLLILSCEISSERGEKKETTQPGFNSAVGDNKSVNLQHLYGMCHKHTRRRAKGGTEEEEEEEGKKTACCNQS